ncbi:MAG TPA: adenylate/guanylate cyclase domain-containing protein [Dehalococcoidia bacterium]|nr:adenylate/guanylate cyclase domain-containing protein [Dehalococcoidia bacterium]
MEREVRYCTTEDGVRIAYCVEGEGTPLLHMANIPWSHVELLPAVPEMAPWYGALASRVRLIRYDNRGSGLSDRQVIDMSRDALVRDIEAVVDHLALDTFTLLGFFFSGPVAITYAERHPDRVSQLILWTVVARMADLPGLPHRMLEMITTLVDRDWEAATHVFAQLAYGWGDEAALRGAAFMRDSCTPEIFKRLLNDNADYDVTPLLPRIKCPTLVLHRRELDAEQENLGRLLASAIPDARLVMLEGKSGEPAIGDMDAVLDVVGKFLRIESWALPPRDAQSDMRTVLFTDLVGHTEMMSRLGDDRGRAVLREHETITRNVLKTYGGTEVKTMGDGFMASFGSVTRAVECAVALQRAIADRNRGVGVEQPPDAVPNSDEVPAVAQPLRASVEPINVRVGLNAGEPIEEDGDLFGATVILASRIAAKADGGEILVADTVRGLCSGKGFLFADRGDFVAKGFEEPVRVYEVNWRA